MAITGHTVEIRYGSGFGATDNYFHFSGMPTPYVSRSQEMTYFGNKWCQVSTVTLDGQIIGSEPVSGENLNTISLKNDREKILSGFSTSFHKLAIYENNTAYKTFEGCMVRDISFSPANYGIQDYSITLECLEKEVDSTDVFIGTFGVMEPVETVNFTDNEDGTMGISHTVSAQGFTTNTASDGANIAIVNAKNFVESRTGYNINKVVPQFTAGIADANLVLTNISRDVNRVEGTYACTIDYIIQTGSIGGFTGDGTFPITAGVVNTVETSITSGVEEDFIQVDVTYTVRGDKYSTPTSIRNKKPTSGVLYDFASGAVTGLGLRLCSLPIDFTIEDTVDTNKSLSVNATYDNNSIYEDLNTGVYFDYTVDVSTDDVTDVAQVTIQGDIIARGNNRAQFKLKSGYYNNEVSGNLFNFANEIYTGVNYNKLYSNTAWALNPLSNSQSVDFDEIAGTVRCNATFNNKDFKANYRKFIYKIDVSPSLNKYSAKPSCNQNGLYGIFNLNAKTRETVNMSIESQGDMTAYNSSPSFDFLGNMHSYSDTLRNAIIGAPSPFKDIVIESESATAPKISNNQQTFDSSITQAYTFQSNTSFYQ